MTRYTINIGDDFPLGDDDRPPGGPKWGGGGWGGPGGRRGPRLGTMLRVLFVISLAAIVLSHPVQSALLLGLVLVLRRSAWGAEWRSRLRGLVRDQMARHGAHAWTWGAGRCGSGWNGSAWGKPETRSEPPAGADREQRRRGYGAFV